jgi:hypothetical protein
MSENGIAWLPTKEDRQIAKLDLAQSKRQLSGTNGYRPHNVYDVNTLPTKYIDNTILDNPNLGGLQPGRPWTGGI